MAVELKFTSSEQSQFNSNLQVYVNIKNELFIKISEFEFDEETIHAVCLDKPTAIKLAKELRKQISMMEG